MGSDAPYMYSQPQASASSFEFNPRAYTQASHAASHAASIKSTKSRPQSQYQSPLIDMNVHPDAWMVIANGNSGVEPLPPNTRSKIVVSRWILFALRVVVLFGSCGLFVCTFCIKGTQGAASYYVHIPPAVDALICAYGVYHLVRPAHERTPASASSYHFFSIIMDGCLIPFYVLICLAAQQNWAQAPGADGRWRTLWSPDTYATSIVLFTTLIASAVLGGLHVFSLVLDILLAVWFRKVSQMPPDMNPLEDHLASRAVSKHKHKNSEMTSSTMSVNEKHLSDISGSTLRTANQSQVSLPKGFSVSAADARLMPFAQSRLDLDATSSPHDSPRMSRSNISERFYAQTGSQHNSRADLLSASDSRPGSRSQSRSRPRSYVTETHEPMPERVVSPGSFVSARSQTYNRMSASPGPQAAVTDGMAKQQQIDGLLTDNWYVEGEGSDIGTPARGRSPRPAYTDNEYTTDRASTNSPSKSLAGMPPPPPPKSDNRPKSAFITEREVDQETEEDIGRALTMGSSIHSDGMSLKRSDSAKAKYYGDLAAARMGAFPVQPTDGNGRVVSRSGVDIDDDATIMYIDNSGKRQVSGKMAEEGRGREFRRREVSGKA